MSDSLLNSSLLVNGFPHPSQPIDGHGLRALVEITVKAEVARNEIIDEIE